MADYPSAFVSSDVASDGIEVGGSDLLKLCRVKDPDTQKNECHKYILGADYTD